MKYFVIKLSILAMLLTPRVHCLGQQVVATSGNHFSNQEMALSWTIGETFTSTHTTEDYALTEGFQQSGLTVTSIFKSPQLRHAFDIYPNPVTQTLYVVNEKIPDNCIVELFNNTGKKILAKTVHPQDVEQKFNFSEFKPGVYHLLIRQTNGGILQRSKIVKI